MTALFTSFPFEKWDPFDKFNFYKALIVPHKAIDPI